MEELRDLLKIVPPVLTPIKGLKQAEIYELNNQTGIRAFISKSDARLLSLFIPGENYIPVNVIAIQEAFDANCGDARYQEPLINNKLKLVEERCDNQTLELSYMEIADLTQQGLKIGVKYTLTDDGELKISYRVNAAANINTRLANPVFFNLNGYGSGTVFNHQVQIRADDYLPVNPGLKSAVKPHDVTGTPFDFRYGATIGARIDDHNEQLRKLHGYVHHFILNKHHALRTPVARVKGDKSGIVMEIFTDKPALYFCSTKHMQYKNDESDTAKPQGPVAFVMEVLDLPGIYREPFPADEIKAGQTYKRELRYRFIHK